MPQSPETTESAELRLTPEGIVAPVSSGPHPARSTLLQQGEIPGLIALAANELPAPAANPSVNFWRDIAADFLRALCHIPENQPLSPESLTAPGPAQLAHWILNAPPMQGAEYLSPDVLVGLWQRLASWTADEADSLGGLGPLLQKHAPRWSRVGRVTLHLAENKGDEDYPFAFMATYASSLTPAGRVRRLPLKQALKEYAGGNRKKELLALLSPLHKAAQRSALISEMIETGDVFHPLVWTPPEAHEFLKEIPLYEDAGLIVLLPNWWRKRTRPRVSVTLDTKGGGTLGLGSIMDFDISIALGDQALTRAEAETLMQSQAGLVRLKGEWVEVDGERLREALEHWEAVGEQVGGSGINFIEGMRLLAGASADLEGPENTATDTAWAMVDAGDRLKDTLSALRSPSGLSSPQPASLKGDLRDYQLAGLNWLWLCSQLGLGACLADDMGLGKTIQILAALLRQKSLPGTPRHPALLVVPASLIGNWKAETAKFAPDISIRIVHPSETSKQEMALLTSRPDEELAGTDLIITTYSMATRLPWLADTTWSWLILDEAQAIKNPGTRQTQAVKKIGSRSSFRVALTGTPVENRIGDLWSIFDFLNPGLLGSAKQFKRFANSLDGDGDTGGARYAPLRNLVAPYILRRLKTDPDIVPDLPDKTEVNVYCGLTISQATLYQQGVKALAEALEKSRGTGIQRRGLVLAHLMRFKQICNHPSQLTGDNVYADEDSSKFQRLATISAEIASRGERILLFTQFREIADPLAGCLAAVFGRPGLVLHGGTPVKKRKDLVADFQRPDGPPFMVLSLKAGGTGLNLTAASHVIHFDRWWNPAIENQATDRAFRIGQKKNVLVHKFVTQGTIEEKIDAIIREKQQVSDAILEGGSEKALTEMSDAEIMDMVTLDLQRASS